ncbi:MAG: amidohydrolase family protein [Proteobacteria bacterium]|nr:amidohydrolase family protein [Pseudomonadota bacterium]
MSGAVPGRTPRLVAPLGACDCLAHVFGPRARFPYPAGIEAPPDLPLEDYERVRARLGLARAVLVQLPHYATDNACILDAVARLGPARARAVAVTRPEVDAAELARLDADGVRALRFLLFAPYLRLDVIGEVARRIAPFGWHVEVQGDGRDLPDQIPVLARLPVAVVIDHLGRIPAEGGTDHPAFRALLAFVEGGRCWVKLSAPYHASRTGPPDYADLAPRARALIAARPDRMLWASNWPHALRRPGEKPDDADLLDLLLDWAPEAETRRLILVENPARLYGFD